MCKKVLVVLLMGIGVIINSGVSKADTYVSGTITSSTIWTVTGSPYIATDTVTVANSVVLTIESGVTVKFASETSLICYGTLNAVGTLVGTITFTSNQITPSAGDWNGIKLSGSGTNGSEISYCDIGYAEQAVYLKSVCNITITHCSIHDNKADDEASGPNLRGDVGCGIYLGSSTNITITQNTLFNNQGGQGGQSNDWASAGGGGVGCGIYLSSSFNNTITHNTLSNNQGGQGGTALHFGTGGRGGIGTGIYFSSSFNNILTQNIISNNQGGQAGKLNASWGTGGFPGQGYGIYFEENSYNNSVDSSNTYNGEPIFYYYGITTPTVVENQSLTLIGSGSTNLGRIVLIRCENFTIRNNVIAGGMGETGNR